MAASPRTKTLPMRVPFLSNSNQLPTTDFEANNRQRRDRGFSGRRSHEPRPCHSNRSLPHRWCSPGSGHRTRLQSRFASGVCLATEAECGSAGFEWPTMLRARRCYHSVCRVAASRSRYSEYFGLGGLAEIVTTSHPEPVGLARTPAHWVQNGSSSRLRDPARPL